MGNDQFSIWRCVFSLLDLKKDGLVVSVLYATILQVYKQWHVSDLSLGNQIPKITLTSQRHCNVGNTCFHLNTDVKTHRSRIGLLTNPSTKLEWDSNKL